ncbi:Rha family transcriptional regulator [Bartonella refiksaydamii]|uniref:Rha family transcriptional regulator n=1 Tax=Bartonella refiksaydamii TaxID=2654951 RepID=UPI003F7205FB
MNNLVTINNDGIAVTTSLKIAEGVGNNHATVIKLVRQNIEDLEEFGRVGFEISPFGTKGGRQKRVIAILNGPQATLLMTYMRNNDMVRAFKKALVKAFYDLKNQLIDNDRDTRFDDLNYLRQYVLTNYPKIMGIIFGRLLKIDEIEKSLIITNQLQKKLSVF